MSHPMTAKEGEVGSAHGSTRIGLTDRQREIGMSVFEEVKAAHPVRLAFFSGSLAAGLGHATSDIDLHVVLGPRASVDRHGYERDDQRVQVTEVPEATIRSVVQRTREFRATRHDRQQTSFSSDLTEFWHLVRTCSSELVGGDDELVELYESIDRRVAAKVLMVRYATEASVFIDDVCGMNQVGDVHSAFYTARMALRSGIEVALASQGDLYSLPKFLIARAARCGALSPILARLWALLEVGPEWHDQEAMRESIFAVLNSTQQVVIDALQWGWDSPGGEFRLPVERAVGPIRDPFLGPIRFSDAWAFPARSGPFRASDDVVALWAACTGQTTGDISDELTGHGIDLQPGDLESVLARLSDRGVVYYPDWDRKEVI